MLLHLRTTKFTQAILHQLFTVRETCTMQTFFIPGTMCNEMLWIPSWALAKRREHFHHCAIPIECAMNKMLDCLAVELPKKPFNLVGFSFGGYLASMFAIKFPHRVNRLLVVSNSACSLSDQEVTARKHTIEWVRLNGYSGLSRQKAKQLIDPSQRHCAELINTLIAMGRALGEAEFMQQLQAGADRIDLSGALSDLAMPMHFCYGKNDPLVNKFWFEQLKKNKPSVVITEISNAAHMMPLEKPYEMARIFDEHCEGSSTI